jgi:phosphatidylserine synthase
MDTSKKLSLFFGVCIPIRLLLVLGAYKLGNNYNGYNKLKIVISIFAILAAIGFVYNGQTKEYGAFGSKRYWSGISHAIFYTLFAITLFKYPEHAWLILLLDVFFGLGTVSDHYQLMK